MIKNINLNEVIPIIENTMTEYTYEKWTVKKNVLYDIKNKKWTENYYLLPDTLSSKINDYVIYTSDPLRVQYLNLFLENRIYEVLLNMNISNSKKLKILKKARNEALENYFDVNFLINKEYIYKIYSKDFQLESSLDIYYSREIILENYKKELFIPFEFDFIYEEIEDVLYNKRKNKQI